VPTSCTSRYLLPTCLLCLLLSGCSFTPHAGVSRSKSIGIKGAVHGGQQPVVGASIQLFAAGSTGDASPATPLLMSAVQTDQNGSFSITSDYTCPSASTEVYLVATGGNPGLPAGTNNASLAMMAALGQCGLLSASTFISINEVTTVGSLAALFPFMSSATNLGASLADAAQLTTAFAQVNEYTNIATGTAPGPALPAGSNASGAQIYTLADIVASCINSAGGKAGDGSSCGTLFNLATPAGGQAPTDTIVALLNILKNPTQNTSALFNLSLPAAPFQPSLSSAPSNWFLPIYVTGTSPTVQVSVTATDTGGRLLTYRWQSTDGVIQNVNASSTTWTLPNGPGLHFAYVLVSNGVGGYTERRIAVNTDGFGAPLISSTPIPFSAPVAPAPQGDYYRSFIAWGLHGPHLVSIPDVSVFVTDLASGNRYPAGGDSVTSPRGDFVVPGVPAKSGLDYHCSFDGGTSFDDCSHAFQNGMEPFATTDYFLPEYRQASGQPAPAISGALTLADGTLCGASNEFFGVTVTATATLLDGNGQTLAGPVRLNEHGEYTLAYSASAANVVLQCESAPTVIVAVTNANPNGDTDLGTATVASVQSPIITSMSAQLGGTQVGSLLPPISGAPSDLLSLPDAFLAEKGLDTRLGACQYYKAVGAVQGCDSAGNLMSPITFDDWRSAVKIDSFASGQTVFSASYINKVDLNLARVHHSVSYGPNQTAAYVCNHLGPSVADPQQPEIDSVVDYAVNGQNLVACVAMDYMVTPGVNNGLPFTRFLIFGPSGQLLPSINLDTRREKFVPGTCVVCHGGDHYAGKFPEDGTGFADVGGHFLPYDTGNFEFSSKPGLAEADQAGAIYSLNQNVLNAGPTPAEQELIQGWYAGGTTLNKSYVSPTFQDAQTSHSIVSISSNGSSTTVTTADTNLYVNGEVVTIAGVSNSSFNGNWAIMAINSPTQFVYLGGPTTASSSSGGAATLNPTAVSFYQNVHARSCRTCHVALAEGYNFDHYANMGSADFYREVGRPAFAVGMTLCGLTSSDELNRKYTMPNSLVTFNRFWRSAGTSADQPAITSQFLFGGPSQCIQTPP